MMSDTTRLRGRSVLVVEDDFLIADDLRRSLESCGAGVRGPVPDVAGALGLIEEEAPDLAVLDVNLGEATAYPVADRLRALGVPFVFATGYDRPSIAAPYRDVALCEKPGDVATCLAELLGPNRS